MPEGGSCSDSMNPRRPLLNASHSLLCCSSLGDRLNNHNKCQLDLCLSLRARTHTSSAALMVPFSTKAGLWGRIRPPGSGRDLVTVDRKRTARNGVFRKDTIKGHFTRKEISLDTPFNYTSLYMLQTLHIMLFWVFSRSFLGERLAVMAGFHRNQKSTLGTLISLSSFKTGNESRDFLANYPFKGRCLCDCANCLHVCWSWNIDKKNIYKAKQVPRKGHYFSS